VHNINTNITVQCQMTMKQKYYVDGTKILSPQINFPVYVTAML